MIHVEIEPLGVRSVRVTGKDGLEQDLSLLVWPIVREAVERLDRRLQRDTPRLLARLKTAGLSRPHSEPPAV